MDHAVSQTIALGIAMVILGVKNDQIVYESALEKEI